MCIITNILTYVGTDGTYNFGHIDHNAYQGSIAYEDVIEVTGGWFFKSAGYSIGSAEFTSKPIAALADTGTDWVYQPSDVVKDYFSQVNNSEEDQGVGAWVFPCNTTLPDFSFRVGANDITIPGKFINLGPVNTTETTICYGGLVSSDTMGGLNIFGSIALQAAFVVFDQGSQPPRVGWASKKLE